jgi:hypothetical protein
VEWYKRERTMSEHDLEKLLGGFAADTLTPEEKQALYTAALQDQQLFNALADEQALRELLSNPDIRRRLLMSLEQKKAPAIDSPVPWLDWFRRPAGIALAGGLTAAALAVVLGVRIYQDSLKQTSQSVATEAATPASPPMPMPPASQPPAPQIREPQPKSKKDTGSAHDMGRKDTRFDNMTTQERSAPLASKQEAAPDVTRDSLKQQPAQEEVRREANAPVAPLSKSAEEVPAAAEQKLAENSKPPAKISAPASMQTTTGAPAAGVGTSSVSARALFYAANETRQDEGRIAREKERAMKSLAESAPQANRLGRPLEGFSQPGKAVGTIGQLKPLGLRYSFVVRGTDGQEREVDAATASKSTESIVLTVEANQEAYLQIWKTVGSSTPQLYWPEKETGQFSQKMTAGHRQQIALPMGNGHVTLTAHLSRVRFGPTTEHEAAMLDRLSPNQIQESITASDQTGSHEQAIYVVSQDPSKPAQIVVEMTLAR